MVSDAKTSVIEFESESRDFFVFQAGQQVFAVPATEVDGTAERRVPARLPYAPSAVLGVISVQGRMLTVIDPLAFLKQQTLETPKEIPLVIIIRGDEQLALAADCREDRLTIGTNELSFRDSSANSGGAGSASSGSFCRNDREILVLDPRKLFAAAMGKLERRRRRS